MDWLTEYYGADHDKEDLDQEGEQTETGPKSPHGRIVPGIKKEPKREKTTHSVEEYLNRVWLVEHEWKA